MSLLNKQEYYFQVKNKAFVDLSDRLIDKSMISDTVNELGKLFAQLVLRRFRDLMRFDAFRLC